MILVILAVSQSGVPAWELGMGLVEAALMAGSAFLMGLIGILIYYRRVDLDTWITAVNASVGFGLIAGFTGEVFAMVLASQWMKEERQRVKEERLRLDEEFKERLESVGIPHITDSSGRVGIDEEALQRLKDEAEQYRIYRAMMEGPGK